MNMSLCMPLFIRRHWERGTRKRLLRPSRWRQLRCEQLDIRNLLAADLIATDFHSDGNDIVVEYDVQNQNAVPFDIGIYASTDGVTPDTLLQTHRINNSAKYAAGSHVQNIVVNFSDSTDDYRLLIILDVLDEVAESNENDNVQAFAGGVFRSGNVVHVHGSEGDDSVTITNSQLVTLNGASHSFSSTVTEFHVRTHAGNDVATSASAKNLWAFGGDGADLLVGGAGSDWLNGGQGDDTLNGGSAIDWMEGEDGDDVMVGGAGDDAMFGGAGYDRMEGQAGADFLSGGDDSDLIYGGTGADMLLGQGGDDIMYSDAADTMVDPGSGLNTLESEDDGYGGYGPELSDLQVNFFYGTLTVLGTITDDDTDDAVVTIGGALDLTDDAEADEDGEFGVSFTALDPFVGWVSVTITDADGNVSGTQWFLIK